MRNGLCKSSFLVLPFLILGSGLSLYAENGVRIPAALLPMDPHVGHGEAPLAFLNWSPSERPSFVLPQAREVASVAEDASSIFPDIHVAKARRAKLDAYRRALTLGNQEACPEFQKLAEDADFNRREFAKLRFWTLCSALVKPTDNLNDVDVAHFPALQALKDDAEMVVTERQEKWPRYLELLSAKIRENRNLREKTQQLEMAVQIAETKNLPEEAKRLRRDLEKLAPRFLKNPQAGDYLDVGQDLIQAREFAKGREYLRKVMTSKFAKFNDQRRAFQAHRNSFKVEQNKPQHLEESEKYYDWLVKNKEWSLAFDSGLYWVRALWTDGQKAKAQKAMSRMEKLFAKRGARLFEIEFIRGRMEEEDANFAKALAHYEKALGLSNKASRVKIEASRAWALRRLGRDIEAAAAFETLAANAPEPGDQLRARFWQGKSLAKAGQGERAQLVFRQVAFDDPVGYYGLIAFHELQHVIPPINASRADSLKGWNALREELEKAKSAAKLDDEIASSAQTVTGDAVALDPNLHDPNLSGAAGHGGTQAVADPNVKPDVGAVEPTATTSSEPPPAGKVSEPPAAGKASEPPPAARGQTALPTGAVAPGLATRETAAEPPAKAALRSLTIDEKVWITDLHLMGEKKILEKYLDGLALESRWDYTTEQGFELLKSYARAGLYLPLFATIGKIEKSQREALLLNHPELLFPMDYAPTIKSAAHRQEIPAELVFSIIRQESAFDPNARSFADAMGLMQILPTQAKNVAKELGIAWSGHDDLYRPDLNIPVGAKMLRQGLDRYDGNFILAIASYNANDRAIKGWLKSRFREDPVEFIEEIAYEETRTYVKLVLRNYIFYKRLANPEMALAFPPECLPDLQKFKHSAGDQSASL